MALSNALLQKLDHALVGTRIHEGFALLENAGVEIEHLAPNDPCAAYYLLTIAQWVDLGYRDHHLLEKLLADFSSVARAEMKLMEFIQLRMAESFVAFASEDVCS